MALAAPQYNWATVSNYCQVGFYPGFSVGQQGAGTMHPVIVGYENTQGTNVEAISLGLPNQLTDPSGALQNVNNCPQHMVWAAPLVPMSGGSLTNGIAGAYDSLIDQTAAKFALYRNNGVNDTLRLGWELQGNSGWGWQTQVNDPATPGVLNTIANYKSMFQRYVTRMRAGGFVGYFDCNGGTTRGSALGVSSWYPGDTYTDIIGMDVYNSINNNFTYKMEDMQLVWDNEIVPQLNSLATFARAHGKKLGFGESGVIINNASSSHTNDTALFYPNLKTWILANIDVMAYVCRWNQNQYSGSNITEDDQDWYCGSPISGSPATTTNDGNPTPNNAAMGTLKNSSNTSATWLPTTSPNRTKSKPTADAFYIAGSLQAPDPVLPSRIITLAGRQVRNSFYPFG